MRAILELFDQNFKILKNQKLALFIQRFVLNFSKNLNSTLQKSS